MKKKLSLIFIFLYSCSLFAQFNKSAKIDQLIRELPQESNVGVAVYDLTAKKYVYTFQADKLCRPASTMKLLTTISALDQPKGFEPFYTTVEYDGIIENDTLKGDLYLVGGFDPEFSDSDLNSLVDAIQQHKLKVITGSIYGDVSMKDSLYWGAGWAWDDTPASFQPYLSPLMLNKGVIDLSISPSIKGEPAQIEILPKSSYYTLYNETLSYTDSLGAPLVTRDWLAHKNDVLVKGNITKTMKRSLNIYRPERFFIHTFAERLSEKGVTVLGACGIKKRNSSSSPIASVETPITKVVKNVLKESDNLGAEALFYRMAAQYNHTEVSATDAIERIKDQIEHLGLQGKNYRIADGSGLSNYNYISPRLLVEFLSYAYEKTDLFQTVYKALPIAGIDGTLKHRMKKSPAYNNVHAKTGYITAINTLAGYLKGQDGHFYAFAIMNQNVLTNSLARNFQDQLCILLCE